MPAFAAAVVLIALVASGCASEEPETRTEPTGRAAKAASFDHVVRGRAYPSQSERFGGRSPPRASVSIAVAACTGDELVMLSNFPETLPPLDRLDEEEAILDEEGQVFCEIYDSADLSPRLRRYVWKNDPRPTYLEVLNLLCAHFPEDRSQTDMVERAIRRLEGVDPRPSVVPSSDAVHD
jgi:hypothetical protein